jgi:hypothetical protein
MLRRQLLYVACFRRCIFFFYVLVFRRWRINFDVFNSQHGGSKFLCRGHKCTFFFRTSHEEFIFDNLRKATQLITEKKGSLTGQVYQKSLLATRPLMETTAKEKTFLRNLFFCRVPSQSFKPDQILRCAQSW